MGNKVAGLRTRPQADIIVKFLPWQQLWFLTAMLEVRAKHGCPADSYGICVAYLQESIRIPTLTKAPRVEWARQREMTNRPSVTPRRPYARGGFFGSLPIRAQGGN